MDRIERVTQAVLRDEFNAASEAYARLLLGAERARGIKDIHRLVKLRERFINSFAMLEAEGEQSE